MYRYIYILTFSLLFVFCSSTVFAQTDDADTTEVKAKKKDMAGHQLTVGVDIFRPILSHFLTDRYAYELALNYYMHNEYYLAAETGWGGSKVDYTDLKYNTTNNFLRFGFNKSVLVRDRPDDWDMMFIGFGAGFADIHRSNASYVIIDDLWGNKQDAYQGKPNFQAYWAELTGGVRVALTKGLFAGWNLRGKFLMNGKSFKDLSPIYIAGYGKGDKNSSFDLNVYISYAIRWKRKSLDTTEDKNVKPVLPASTNVSDTTGSTKPALRNKADAFH